ncbi:methyltransferase domain-containing protein [Streptomyces sp. IBSBF 2435]|uniref:methyltransferase domain-containing protein n=1 Tax=Streptomyces sp. IBSBF 2435 TaxID=2903531 RepID=UPI002FDC6977
MAEFERERERLADTMDKRGAWPARSPWIREAVDTLPRHAFAPDRLWRWDGGAYTPVDRATDAEQWADEVYADPDAAAVTQIGDGVATSSLSSQGVVVDMLDSLLLEPGHAVLELGAGTGWNAALLARRAAPGRVVSVEVDAELADRARARLAAVGAAVDVEVGDGTKGWPAGAAYDRVIATYAVERVPWAWVEQTRPGGRIVTPWGRLGHVALTVAADGRSASGWMQGLGQFMPARGVPGYAESGYAAVRGREPATRQREFTRDLTVLRDDTHLLFALRVALPDLRVSSATDADGVNAWLHDGRSSWAAFSVHDTGRTTAYEGGPRSLTDELELAWDQWLAADRPDVYDHGMTVTATEQFVWVHGPDRVVRGQATASRCGA